MIKNAFYFTSKALFVLKLFKFLTNVMEELVPDTFLKNYD